MMGTEKRVEIFQSTYGPKIKIISPYNEELVRAMRGLDWQQYHQRWNSCGRFWEVDPKPEVVRLLKKFNFSISDEVKSIVVNKRGIVNKREEEKLVIKLAGNRGYLNGPERFLKQIYRPLHDSLAFRPEGYEWSNKYRSGEWDGYVRLYHVKTHSFPVGLLPKVTQILDDLKIPYEVQDTREVGGNPMDVSYRGPALRPYQQEVVNRALEEKTGTIQAATGAGKTLIAIKLIAELKRPTVILVHRQELLYQWERELIANLGVRPALLGDGHWEEGPITVAMLQTVHSRGLANSYDVVVFDETHHVPADTFTEVAKKIGARYRFGLSATPWRTDGRDMQIWAHAGTIIAKVDVEKLVEEGYLARPRFQVILGAHTHSGEWPAEYDEAIFEEERTRRIVEHVKKLHEQGHKIYVDVVRVEHGRMLAEELTKAGVPAKFIFGGDPTEKRQHVLARFEQDGFVLVSTLIKEGVDLPKMSALVLAGGGKSSVRVIQTIGRALRPKPGANEALIVDVKDTGRYLSEHYENRQKAMQEYYNSLTGDREPESLKIG